MEREKWTGWKQILKELAHEIIFFKREVRGAGPCIAYRGDGFLSIH
jgi:hypothetical protein